MAELPWWVALVALLIGYFGRRLVEQKGSHETEELRGKKLANYDLALKLRESLNAQKLELPELKKEIDTFLGSPWNPENNLVEIHAVSSQFRAAAYAYGLLLELFSVGEQSHETTEARQRLKTAQEELEALRTYRDCYETGWAALGEKEKGADHLLKRLESYAQQAQQNVEQLLELPSSNSATT